MSADDVANSAVLTVSNYEGEFYLVNTAMWSDTHREMSVTLD